MTAPVLYRPSTEQFESTITARTDPTNSTVEFTFTTARDLTGSETWVAGTWEGDAVARADRYRARAVTPNVGPSQGIDPTDGLWHAFCRIGGTSGAIKYVGTVRVR